MIDHDHLLRALLGGWFHAGLLFEPLENGAAAPLAASERNMALSGLYAKEKASGLPNRSRSALAGEFECPP